MDTGSDISAKWAKEDNRTFLQYPGLPTPDNGAYLPGEVETWLEIAQFVKADLLSLLSFEHPKFWSHMVYNPSAHDLLLSFLKRAPPNFVKKELLISPDVKTIHSKIEGLVFLVFCRLATERESETHHIRNLGQLLYNNYLFTVPIILDICSIYGVSNGDQVAKLIGNVMRLAPDFLDDFQEIPPHFLRALKTVREKVLEEQLPKLGTKRDLRPSEIRDLIFYLHDSVTTLQLFLEVYPDGCELFREPTFVSEIVSFYANVLPELEKSVVKMGDQEASVVDLIENCRLDMLRLTRSVLQWKDNSKGKDEAADECLTLMMELLTEPIFLSDYNTLFSVEFEIESITSGCSTIDTMKVDHILDGLALRVAEEVRAEERVARNREPVSEEGNIDEVKLNSLITQVLDILPHLEESFIRRCLKYCDHDAERVIAGVLENTLPSSLEEEEEERHEPKRENFEKVLEDGREVKEIRRTDRENFKDVLDDRSEVKQMRERYERFGFVEDNNYDDEYDDTYDENIDVEAREGDEEEKERRPFVIPRVLRTGEEAEKEEEDDEEEDVEEDDHRRKDYFVQNPAELREKYEQRRGERERRDVVGGARGRGQSRQVNRNREFKGTHKSFMANHNRKKQAGRKMQHGMIPS